VLHELSEVAGLLAAEQAGLPYVSFHWTGTGVEMLALMIGDAWDELRDLADLPRDPEMAALGRWLTIAAMPASWAEPSSDDRTLRLRLPLFDRAPTDAEPEWLSDLDSGPLVYATLGTVFNDRPGVLDALIIGLGDIDASVIVTTGRNIDPTSLPAAAANVRVERYLPQSLLLPRADAIVHHSGFNTLLGGLNYGLPQVLIPLGGDQPILASRAAEVGVGIVVPEVDQRVPETIAAAAARILDEPTYTDAARRFQSDIEQLPGIDSAVDAISDLV